MGTPKILLMLLRRHVGAVCGLALFSIPAFASTTFSYTGSEQQYTIPVTGVYLLVAYGAQGGYGVSDSIPGGLGAEVGGDYSFTAGTVLDIYVGQAGSTGMDAGGGGGGTFIVLDSSTSTPFLIAGGGGGGSGGDVDGQPGLTTTVNSGGGGSSGATYGGGGGGFLGAGAGDSGCSAGGGAAFPTLTGGSALSYEGVGGYGGGGGGCIGGGGGGGYGGGNGATDSAGGGGGGSYLDSGFSGQIGISGENSGGGSVTLSLAAPEPGSFGLIFLGLLGLRIVAFARRSN